MSFLAEGRCLCGAVRVVAHSPPVRMAQCHCLDCQRISGTGHAVNALFDAAAVEVTGETRGFGVTADSGNTLTRHFCVACGSRMYHHNTGRPGMIMVPAGVFEESDWFKPTMRLYVRRQRLWDTVDENIPGFEAMAPAPASQK